MPTTPTQASIFPLLASLQRPDKPVPETVLCMTLHPDGTISTVVNWEGLRELAARQPITHGDMSHAWIHLALAIHDGRFTPIASTPPVKPAPKRCDPLSGISIRNISVLSYAQGFTLWHYKMRASECANIIAPGFFDALAGMVQPGDLIIATCADPANAAQLLVTRTSGEGAAGGEVDCLFIR